MAGGSGDSRRPRRRRQSLLAADDGDGCHGYRHPVRARTDSLHLSAGPGRAGSGPAPRRSP
ncbi:hypothetical protein CQ040_08235, partial [Microbacterium sp. MYb54]